MKRILFVDDEPKVLEGIKRMLYPLRRELETAFVNSGEQALELLAQQPFDVIVSDMRMPVMSGAELLLKVAELYPQMVRLILSGTWDQDLRMQAAMAAHQYLSKPCDPETLKSTFNRAFSLRDLLDGTPLKSLVSRIISLPSIPSIYLTLIEALRSPDTSIHQIGEIIGRDMAMTAKILQLANSAIFGARHHITKPADAVAYLGTDAIRALALSISAFSAFQARGNSRFTLEALQRHCAQVGTLASQIAKLQAGSRLMLDDAMVAGLLHDIGKLVLAHNFAEQYDQVLDLAVQTGQREAELQVFGSTHCEIGAYLLWLWGLPDAVVESVAFHHEPAEAAPGEFTPLVAVHAADALLHGEVEPGDGPAHNPLDKELLTRLKLIDQLPAWIEARDEQGEDA